MFLGSKVRPVWRADILTAICEPTTAHLEDRKLNGRIILKWISIWCILGTWGVIFSQLLLPGTWYWVVCRWIFRSYHFRSSRLQFGRQKSLRRSWNLMGTSHWTRSGAIFPRHLLWHSSRPRIASYWFLSPYGKKQCWNFVVFWNKWVLDFVHRRYFKN
jgi:hypothetical protein